jgi:hypothetical protein
MFNRKRNAVLMDGNKKYIVLNEKRRWRALIIPEPREIELRTLRYLEAKDGTRVFVEKSPHYKFYVVSVGANPKSVTVAGIAGDLRSAITIANDELTKINAGQR